MCEHLLCQPSGGHTGVIREPYASHMETTWESYTRRMWAICKSYRNFMGAIQESSPQISITLSTGTTWEPYVRVPHHNTLTPCMGLYMNCCRCGQSPSSPPSHCSFTRLWRRKPPSVKLRTASQSEGGLMSTYLHFSRSNSDILHPWVTGTFFLF